MSKWRLLTDNPCDGAWNMSVDESVLAHARGTEDATLRLYSWREPWISIGYAQDAAEFVASGLPVVRRLSGGRSVLHHKELTYCLVCADGHPLIGGGVLGAYKAISSAIISALKAVGVQAELVPRIKGSNRGKASCFNAPSSYEVSTGGRKIAGSAQKRIKGAMLQHGSILLELDCGMYDRVFGSGSSVEAASVREFSSVTGTEFNDVFVDAMRGVLGDDFYSGELTVEERRFAVELEEKKYTNPEWNQGARPCGVFALGGNAQALII